MEGQKDLPFFSIIVPAHNEEQYIEESLRHLAVLDYPKDRYEVLVLENGSTDATFEKASACASAPIRVIKLPKKGVSYARNQGIDGARPDADWLLFLDADTYFDETYLTELAAFLQSLPPDYVVGGTSVLPLPSTPKARTWFAFYDVLHRLWRHATHVTLVRASARGGMRYAEDLRWMEDVHFVNRMKRRGRFFFFRTKHVYTSTRRNERDGWLKLFLWQIGIGMLPPSVQRYFDYSPVR